MNVKSVLFYPLGVVFGFFVLLFSIALMMVTGVPIHDFNLWRMERSFKTVVTHHPSDSVLIEKKKYLGGPYTHGGGSCTYAVGEVRSSLRSKEEIIKTYKNLSVVPVQGSTRIPIKVLFIDDSQWSATSPLYDWWDELREQVKSTSSVMYLVYAMHEDYPFLGDYRCDD